MPPAPTASSWPGRGAAAAAVTLCHCDRGAPHALRPLHSGSHSSQCTSPAAPPASVRRCGAFDWRAVRIAVPSGRCDCTRTGRSARGAATTRLRTHSHWQRAGEDVRVEPTAMRAGGRAQSQSQSQGQRKESAQVRSDCGFCSSCGLLRNAEMHAWQSRAQAQLPSARTGWSLKSCICSWCMSWLERSNKECKRRAERGAASAAPVYLAALGAFAVVTARAFSAMTAAMNAKSAS